MANTRSPNSTRNMSLQRLLLKYYQEHANVGVHYADAAEALGLEGSNVSTTLSRICQRHPELGIRRTASGIYMYVSGSEATVDHHPEPPKMEPVMYEEVGVTENGRVVIRDEKGVLYSREPL